MKNKLSSKKQTEYNLLYKSLIGNELEIVDSKNKKQVGIKGKLVYETANFFVIENNSSNIKILKKNVQLKIMQNGKALYIDGRFLFSTLTNRIKKLK